MGEQQNRVPEHAAKIETVDQIRDRAARFVGDAGGSVVAEAVAIDRDQIRHALTAAFLVPDGQGGFGPTEDPWSDDIQRVQAVLDKIGGAL